MKNSIPSPKTIGVLLIMGAVTLLIPYIILTSIFDYPNILRQDTAEVLLRFHEGGNKLIWTWFAFAITGLPLIPAFIFIGQRFEQQSSLLRFATTLGVISLLVQMIGLLRWTFIVPVIAESFVHASDEATKAAAIMSFKIIHQFGGVILGEYLGQLFTIVWTILVSLIFVRLKLLPAWLNAFGIISALIYLMAQAELFATVMPGFPVWDLAGFMGSSLWLVWLILLGIYFIKMKDQNNIHPTI